MKKILLTLFLISFANIAVSLTLNEQRELYAQASELQKQEKWSNALQKMQLIPQYPLIYLLEYQQLKAHFTADSLAAIQSFLKKYPDHVVSQDLQREYLYYLGKNSDWEQLLHFYPNLPNSVDLKCFYFQAKLAHNQENKIWQAVKNTWLTGVSLPNACDPVLQYYLKNKKIDQKLILQRFQLSYEKKQTVLMRYLITLMDNSNKVLAEKLLALSKQPEKLLTSTLFTNRKQQSHAYLDASIKHLARKDIQLGVQAYLAYEQKIPFTLKEKLKLKEYLISRILIAENETLLPWLDKALAKIKEDKLIERRIRYAIKLDDWSAIEYWLMQLSKANRSKEKWLYWQARVWEEKKENKKANKVYNKIASNRSYYGFLAAQKLGINYQFNAQIITVKNNKLSHLKKQLTHIEELHYQQHFFLLKREWRKLLTGKTVDLQNQLGLFAASKDWAHLSVVASINSKSWDALNIRFPATEAELFAFYANKYQLDSTYIYAITRQESAFDEFANSPAGARGYMQLMPQTAKETAKKIGLKTYKQRSQLNEGEINVELGSAYLNSLIQRYQGNRILATAAYNAGPHRVDRWQNGRESGLLMDSWIETIPYKETRQYVKNVLAYNVIYQHIFNKPLLFMTDKEFNARF